MKQIFPLLLILLVVLTSCRKTEPDPCEGLLNEGSPSEIIVKFIDKQTKETLVVDAAVIKVTEKQSGNPFRNWSIYKLPNSSVLNGGISIRVFHESVGEHQYSIQIGDFGTAILSYQINREETDNPCKPFSYSMKDIKITNQPFEILQHEGKTYPKILVVML